MAKQTFTFQGQDLPVTMSAGICSITQADSVDSMLRQADLELYNAKEAGRNRISPLARNEQVAS